MEPINHAEQIVEVTPAHYFTAISPPSPRVTKEMVDILEGGGAKSGSLRASGVVPIGCAKLALVGFLGLPQWELKQ